MHRYTRSIDLTSYVVHLSFWFARVLLLYLSLYMLVKYLTKWRNGWPCPSDGAMRVTSSVFREYFVRNV